MKKTLVKPLCLLLALAMALCAFGGCGTTKTSSAASTAEATTSAASEAESASPAATADSTVAAPSATVPASAEEPSSAAEPGTDVALQTVSLPVVDTETHYSCWMPMAPYVSTMINMDDFSNEIAMVKTISESTNVYVDFNAVAGGMEEQNLFNLMVAAADYCDIIGVMHYYATGIQGAIDEGVIVDIKDDLEEYCPNYWSLLTADEDAYITMLTDSGNMGCIAQLYKESGLENQGPLYRQDWLDALGLAVPTTYDELEAYLLKCKEDYGAYAYLQYEGKDTDLGAGYNLTPAKYNVVDGKVVAAYDTDASLQYLTMLNQWYTEGIFDEDFYNSTDITEVRRDMANDMCSFVDGSAEGISNIFDFNPENTAMVVKAMPYVTPKAGDEVHVGFTSNSIKNSDTWAISTTCDDYIPLLGLVNYLYSEEGQLVYNWGNEGESYTLDADGNPQWTDLVIHNPDGLNFMFASYLYATGVGSVYYPGVYDMTKGFYSYTPEQLESVEILANLTDGSQNLPAYVATSLSTEEQTEYNSYASDLDTYANSMLLKFIIGDEPLENYDSFVSQLYDMGLQNMVDIYQTVYDRTQEAAKA